MGCKVISLSTSYLGLLLCVGKTSKALLNPVVERLEQRLAYWKAKYLSSGSRISLIQSALADLPIYFMSIFKCPASIIKHLEKLRRDFLWQGPSDKKFHLVGWKSVCKPKEGGLGFRPF